MVMRVFLALVLMTTMASAVSAKSRDPIRFAEGTNATQQVVIAIARRALKKAGFTSELLAVETTGLVGALEDGTVHTHPAVPIAMHPDIADSIAAKTVRSLGGLARNQPDEPLLKLVWPGMKRKWPDAQKLLKRMVLPRSELATLAGQISENTTAADIANSWWATNRKTWSPWIAASKNWMKP